MKKESIVLEGVEFIVEVNDGGEKTVSVNGVDINLNFNGIRLATIENKINLKKIYDFVNKYKYDGDEIEVDDNGINRGLPLCIGGYEFHGHWEEIPNKDTYTMCLNDFIPDYNAIVNGLADLDDSISSEFLSPKYYEDDYKDFVKSLKDLGITIYNNSADEYDILATFYLPSSNLNDEEFFEKFMNIFSTYKNKYEEELNALCN